jgi:hypothetical protein
LPRGRVAVDLPQDRVDQLDPATARRTAVGQAQVLLYWYLQRFAGRWTFARMLSDPGRYRVLDCTSHCPLAGCRRDGVALARSG